MEWEPVVPVAQIATGLATLIVADFLAGQFNLQRKALNRAHVDSERELAFSAAVRRDNIVLARLNNGNLEKTVMNGIEDISSFTEPIEIHRFQSYIRLLESCLHYDWSLGRDSNQLSTFENQIAALLATSSLRKHYQNVGRKNIHNSELRELMDRQYQLLEGESGSTHVGDNKDYVDVRTAT